MAIKVQCPNAACGHVISVRDEYAGKRGKCPACGSAMMIPAAVGMGISPPPAPPLQQPKSDPVLLPADTAGFSSITPAEDLRLPPADTLDVFALPESPPPPVPAPPPAETPALPPAPVSGLTFGYSMAELSTRTALIIGIVALLLISFIPQVRWLQQSDRSGQAELAEREGQHFLIHWNLSATGVSTTLLVYSAILALLAVGCLVSLDLLPRQTSDSLIAAVSALAGGWGVTVFFWMLGYIWKAFTTASYFGDREHTILPGFGLVFGFFAALSVMAVFGYLVVNRQRFLWLGVAGGGGFFFGILLLLFNARPWVPWPLR